MRGKRWTLAGSLALLVAFGAGWAVAQSAQTAATGNPEAELKTAVTHAGFAAKYDALKEVTTHLHHTINCLVGPQDKRFDSGAGNPCQSQGNGVLPDLKAKNGESAQYYEAQWAAEVANQGVTSSNLQEAKAAARVAGLVLTDASKMQ